MLIGLFVRPKVVESPLFRSFDREAEDRRVPLVQVLTRSPWVLLLGRLVAMSQLTISGMASVWGLSYATAHGADQTFALNAKVLSAVALFACAILSARLSDRFGRRPVIAVGIVAVALFAYPLVVLVATGENVSFAVAVVGGRAIQGIILGPLAAFLAELFPTSVRFTGSFLAFQGASAIGAGFTEEAAHASVDRDRAIRIRDILGVDDEFTFETLSQEDWVARRLVADTFRERRPPVGAVRGVRHECRDRRWARPRVAPRRRRDGVGRRGRPRRVRCGRSRTPGARRAGVRPQCAAVRRHRAELRLLVHRLPDHRSRRRRVSLHDRLGP